MDSLRVFVRAYVVCALVMFGAQSAHAGAGAALNLFTLYSTPAGTAGNTGALTLPGVGLSLDVGNDHLAFVTEIGLNSRNVPVAGSARDFSSVYALFGGRWKPDAPIFVDLQLAVESLKAGTLFLTTTINSGVVGSVTYHLENGLQFGLRYLHALSTVASGSLKPSYLALSIGFRIGSEDR